MTLGGVVSGPTFTCRHARTHACMFYICFVVPSPRSLVCAAHMNAGKRSGYFYCAFRCRCAGSQHRRLVSCDGDPAWTATWWPRHTRVCVCVCGRCLPAIKTRHLLSPRSLSCSHFGSPHSPVVYFLPTE